MKIGIVGGGQLARMLALAGYPLGLQFRVLDPSADACAGQVAPLVTAAYDDQKALDELAGWADTVTFDFENVPARAASRLAGKVTVFPGPAALAAAQDRFDEKTLFRRLDIATAPFAAVDSLVDLHHAVREIGLPAVLKTRRLGYDGKGQQILRDPSQLEPGYAALADVPLILEGFVPFQRELSILALRGSDGRIAFYPLTENLHRNGILRLSTAPFSNPELTGQAQAQATRVLQHLDYVGLLAIEFFVVEDRLLANEMAPRVHNSGHWTIEGAETSQFENHLRAGLGWPLGATAARGHSAMLNAIGALPERSTVLSTAGAHYHDYGKAARPGRKVGHVTLRANERAALSSGLKTLGWTGCAS